MLPVSLQYCPSSGDHLLNAYEFFCLVVLRISHMSCNLSMYWQDILCGISRSNLFFKLRRNKNLCVISSQVRAYQRRPNPTFQESSTLCAVSIQVAHHTLVFDKCAEENGFNLFSVKLYGPPDEDLPDHFEYYVSNGAFRHTVSIVFSLNVL